MGLLNFESFNGADFLNLDVLAKQIFKFERFAKRIKIYALLARGFWLRWSDSLLPRPCILNNSIDSYCRSLRQRILFGHIKARF